MTVTVTYKEPTSVPVEVEGLTPDWICDKSLAEIERFEIFCGNRKLPLAELFSVSGDPSDKRIEFAGPLSGVHWIGAHMKSGEVHVCGSAGRHVGSAMRGGEINVHGDAAGWVGAEMKDGTIRIKGNSGLLTGGAYQGSTKGMRGGTILVDGNAGNEVGLFMRRGLIAISGSSGDMTGFNMIAGTIAVFGDCGIRPGAGMRRGTIALFGKARPQLLPSFRFASTFRPLTIRLMLKTLKDQRFSIDESLLTDEFDLYHGDLVTHGRGEVILRHELSA